MPLRLRFFADDDSDSELALADSGVRVRAVALPGVTVPVLRALPRALAGVFLLAIVGPLAECGVRGVEGEGLAKENGLLLVGVSWLLVGVTGARRASCTESIRTSFVALHWKLKNKLFWRDGPVLPALPMALGWGFTNFGATLLVRAWSSSCLRFSSFSCFFACSFRLSFVLTLTGVPGNT